MAPFAAIIGVYGLIYIVSCWWRIADRRRLIDRIGDLDEERQPRAVQVAPGRGDGLGVAGEVGLVAVDVLGRLVQPTRVEHARQGQYQADQDAVRGLTPSGRCRGV